MRIAVAVIVLLVGSCVGQDDPYNAPPPTSSIDQELAVPDTCINPIDNNDPTGLNCVATPNNATDDDRCGFQAAINVAMASTTTKRQVCIPAGVFDIGPASGGNRSLDVNGATNLSIAGAGPATVLKFKASTGPGNDWALIQVRGTSSNVTLRDFAIDGNDGNLTSGMTNATYGVRIGGCNSSTVTGVQIEAVDTNGVYGGGISLCGTGGAVRAISITHSRFINNRINGVYVEAGTANLTISNNYFAGTQTGADIRMQSTASGQSTDFVISNNIIAHTSGCLALELAGVTATCNGGSMPCLIERGTIAKNLISGGNVNLENVGRLVVSSNIVNGGASESCTGAVLQLAKGVEDVAFATNIFSRPSTANSGDVLYVTKSGSSLTPTRLTFQGEVYKQYTGATIASIESASRVTVDASMFQYFGTATGKRGLQFRSPQAAISGITVSSSAFLGSLAASNPQPLAEAVRFEDTNNVDGVVVTGNRSTNATLGLKLDFAGGGTYLDAPVVADNHWPGEYVLSGGTPVIASGNSFRGWAHGATPTGTCTNGALHTEISTGKLYVCESAAWVVK